MSLFGTGFGKMSSVFVYDRVKDGTQPAKRWVLEFLMVSRNKLS